MHRSSCGLHNFAIACRFLYISDTGRECKACALIWYVEKTVLPEISLIKDPANLIQLGVEQGKNAGKLYGRKTNISIVVHALFIVSDF